jgi:hypothetical protein
VPRHDRKEKKRPWAIGIMDPYHWIVLPSTEEMDCNRLDQVTNISREMYKLRYTDSNDSMGHVM